ncbi:hypothetical protein M427DRAFT_300083 [Gonapodya prolifera JEL478]|uniref:Uncharacterized protein n=1 Tax=Gonapodya prolifera (strain JEL478) TaxID=1344416 RepID=A0A138ZWZ2_GONPJ|nr:hypothetical protein M427DRAFT_300083 [Gonapodya prolifera JEL478]|eukprot:KXS08795.1 hypothetical protein M427DRAFT_300083 [Gonapodya prolifera JEL478]
MLSENNARTTGRPIRDAIRRLPQTPTPSSSSPPHRDRPRLVPATSRLNRQAPPHIVIPSTPQNVDVAPTPAPLSTPPPTPVISLPLPPISIVADEDIAAIPQYAQPHSAGTDIVDVYAPLAPGLHDDIPYSPTPPLVAPRNQRDDYMKYQRKRDRDPDDIDGYPLPATKRLALKHPLRSFEDMHFTDEHIKQIESHPNLNLICFCQRAIRTHAVCYEGCAVCFICADKFHREFKRDGKTQCPLFPADHSRLPACAPAQMDLIYVALDSIPDVLVDGTLVPPFECNWCSKRFRYNDFGRHRTYQCTLAQCTLPECTDLHKRSEKAAIEHRLTKCKSPLSKRPCKNKHLAFQVNGVTIAEDSDLGCKFVGTSATETTEHERKCNSYLHIFGDVLNDWIEYLKRKRV